MKMFRAEGRTDSGRLFEQREEPRREVFQQPVEASRGFVTFRVVFQFEEIGFEVPGFADAKPHRRALRFWIFLMNSRASDTRPASTSSRPRSMFIRRSSS